MSFFPNSLLSFSQGINLPVEFIIIFYLLAFKYSLLFFIIEISGIAVRLGTLGTLYMLYTPSLVYSFNSAEEA